MDAIYHDVANTIAINTYDAIADACNAATAQQVRWKVMDDVQSQAMGKVLGCARVVWSAVGYDPGVEFTNRSNYRFLENTNG
jgi:hypothetical protein